MRVGDKTVIIGGMVYDSKGHDPSGSFRELSTGFEGTSWDEKMICQKEEHSFVLLI